MSWKTYTQPDAVGDIFGEIGWKSWKSKIHKVDLWHSRKQLARSAVEICYLFVKMSFQNNKEVVGKPALGVESPLESSKIED